MRFEPIAIVARSCLLPGALDPEALWQGVLRAESALSAPRTERFRASAVAERSGVGGYVTGVEALPWPESLAAEREQWLGLDVLHHWVLRCAESAVRAAGHSGRSARAGFVLGLSGLPSAALTDYAHSVWLDAQGPAFLDGEARARLGLSRPAARNRFVSGLTASLTAEALGLLGPALTVDAGDASALYALKLACDRLHDRNVDFMLVGAASAAERSLLHASLSALSLLSPSGQSRPLQRAADGLVPAEGAACVVLKRLSDALHAGDTIHAVIRGIGVAHTRPAAAPLEPSPPAFVEAMQRALAGAGLAPGSVGLLECQAYGVPRADAAELSALSEVYASASALALGSVAENIGHTFSAAGMAGLLKLCASLEAGLLPPSRASAAPADALAAGPFRLLASAERFSDREPRRAALNAYGWGGQYAHVVLEHAVEASTASASSRVQLRKEPIALVGVCTLLGDDDASATLSGPSHRPLDSSCERRQVALDLPALGLTTAPLERLPASQLVRLKALAILGSQVALPSERSLLFWGAETDLEATRDSARLALEDWAQRFSDAGPGMEIDPTWRAQAAECLAPELDSVRALALLAGVPCLPDGLDLASLRLCAGAHTGSVALELAMRALQNDELDVALVGAIDLDDELVRRTVRLELGETEPALDAVVVLALRRLCDAERLGESVIAVLEPSASVDELAEPLVAPPLSLPGAPHVTSELLRLSLASDGLAHGARLGGLGKWLPWFGARALRLSAPQGLKLRSHRPAVARPSPSGFRIETYSGAQREAVLEALARGEPGEERGPCRLVIVSRSVEESVEQRAEAQWYLRHGGPAPQGVSFREARLEGEVAFVFTGAAASYPNMASELLLALPQLSLPFHGELRDNPEVIAALHRGFEKPELPQDQLCACSLVCQAHARLSREVLGLSPDAVFGYSSGEANALIATSAWRDPQRMARESLTSPLFSRLVAGEFEALAVAFRKRGFQGDKARFRAYVVAERPERIRELLRDEALVHLTIINSRDECVVGGEEAACERFVTRLGRGRAWPVEYHLAAHCPELEEVRDAWYAFNYRPTYPVPGVRFYWNASEGPMAPSASAAAEALTQQALTTFDFPRLVERAYADGVRVFVEHGPKGLCSTWIGRILGDRPHLAASYDVAGRGALAQLANAVAALLAAGVKLDVQTLCEQLCGAAPEGRFGSTTSFQAPRAALRLPPWPGRAQLLARAPELAAVLDVDLDPEPAPVPLPAEPGLRPSALARPSVQPNEPHVMAMPERPESDPQAALASPLFAELDAVHSDYLRAAAAAQQAFLAAQTRLLSQWLAYSGATFESATFEPLLPETSPTPCAPAFQDSAPVLFERPALEEHAGGQLARVFGPEFAAADDHPRRVRLPLPPLLLVDRITRIDAERGSLGTGSLISETDIRRETSFGHAGRIPAGIMVESGQAVLFLLSFLGFDWLNAGQRVYRLLGYDLTYLEPLPREGETLVYHVSIDGHANQGGVRLSFFHYDCYVGGRHVLSLRNGQSGFFSEQELRGSAGLQWEPSSVASLSPTPLAEPPRASDKRAFSDAEVSAFARGDLLACFGPGFERTRAHAQTPRIPQGPMQLLQRVSEFAPRGGPWGRGYLRGELSVTADAWFFPAHFKNDPCQPGTLMMEGSLQAMAFFLTAMGFTLDRDAHHFAPAPGQSASLRCRGQVTPRSKTLTYEVFVTELHDGATPLLKAHVLCTVDGLRALHAADLCLCLAPNA